MLANIKEHIRNEDNESSGLKTHFQSFAARSQTKPS